MRKIRVLPLIVGLAAATTLLGGCLMPVAPDVTPTPAGDVMATSMAESVPTAIAYTTSLTQVSSPPPTPTLAPPTTVPTVAPTTPPTVAPTAPAPQPTTVPTQAPPTQEPPGTETTYVVQPGDNLFRIALRHGLTMETLAAYNGITNPSLIYVGQVIRIPAGGTTPNPSPGGTSYTVQPGDNLFRIALSYNLNYLYLASYNGISNPHSIYVGQVIRIPSAP